MDTKHVDRGGDMQCNDIAVWFAIQTTRPRFPVNFQLNH